MIRPLDSASGMNDAGGTMVPSGLRQRISTSAPRSRPERMSTIGWKYGTNSPALQRALDLVDRIVALAPRQQHRKRKNDDRQKSAGDRAQCAQIALVGGKPGGDADMIACRSRSGWRTDR